MHSLKQTGVEDEQLARLSYQKHLVTFQEYQVLVRRRLGITGMKNSQKRNPVEKSRSEGTFPRPAHFSWSPYWCINNTQQMHGESRSVGVKPKVPWGQSGAIQKLYHYNRHFFLRLCSKRCFCGPLSNTRNEFCIWRSQTFELIVPSIMI